MISAECRSNSIATVAEGLSLACRNGFQRRRRTMRRFAEDEIRIPTGPYRGRKFSCHRQPYSGHFFDLVDSGRFNRIFATGPSQSGKTLTAFVIPILYHLFELSETVIVGVPTVDVASDKWYQDLLPVIERTKYVRLLPPAGAKTVGGKINSFINFRNGAMLRWMTAGGDDKSRAAFTSRVVMITEVDGFDTSSSTSREADKVAQLEARTQAYQQSRQHRIYGECTVSIESGRTWQEYTAGTETRLALQCPGCSKYVTPDREHLTGWHDAETEFEAEKNSAFACPECGCLWSDDELVEANLASVPVHRGQEVDRDGVVTGEVPETYTLGFRWGAASNLFVPPGAVGVKEFKARRADDEENAERELLQFVYALPYQPPEIEETPLDRDEITRRQLDPPEAFAPGKSVEYPRGLIPEGAERVTCAIDLGKWFCHWSAISWQVDGTPHVFDYGVMEPPSDQLGTERAITATLKQFRDQVMEGWPERGQDSEHRRIPDQVWIDAGYQFDAVLEFCREVSPNKSKARFRPYYGRGQSQYGTTRYTTPKRKNTSVRKVGEEYLFSYHEEKRIFVVEVNADYWKTWIHERMATPLKQPGALTLYTTDRHQHLGFVRQATAEKKLEEFTPGKGTTIKWVKVHRENHWLDTLYANSAAAHFCGIRIKKPKASDRPATERKRAARKPRKKRKGGTPEWARKLQNRGRRR